ncbi:MAG: flagellar basal-body rod protein FlgF [Alphaproteobacteria bacterium]
MLVRCGGHGTSERAADDPNMSSAGYISLSRQMALQNQLDIIAHNIANSTTSGFQGQAALFTEFLAQAQNGETLSYIHDRGMVRNTQPGALEPTASPLDVAIEGQGYFVVETEEGPRYTRDGAFRLDADGQLVTSAGAPVMSEGDLPIIFAPGESDIQISADGTVSTENGEIGKLRIVTFEDEQDMRPLGSALLSTDQIPLEAPDARVLQGVLEGSNVRPVVEITRMIDVMRTYQATARMIESENERQRRALQLLARTV